MKQTIDQVYDAATLRRLQLVELDLSLIHIYSAVPPAEEEGASNPAPDDGSAVPPAENAEDENAPLPEQTDTSETGDQPDGMAADDVADEDETEDLDATQDSADTVVPENSLLMGAAQPMACLLYTSRCV